jgi:hypothetical protein
LPDVAYAEVSRCEGVADIIQCGPPGWDSNYAALLSASILRNQFVNRFQLALFWSTILRSRSASFGSVNQASL